MGKLRSHIKGSVTIKGRELVIQYRAYVHKLYGEEGDKNLYLDTAVPEDMITDMLKVVKESHGLSGTDAEKEAKLQATNEWVDKHCNLFYFDIRWLYKFVRHYHEVKYSEADTGFPPGVQYVFPDKRTPTGSSYAVAVLDWVEEQLKDQDLFPESQEDLYLVDFMDKYASKIMTRLFRIYAMIWTSCHPELKLIGATNAAKMWFKWFFYFLKR